MRNTEKYDVRRVIMISFGDFEKLIDDATDGLKTVEFTPGIFLNNSEKAEKEEVYEQRNACEILSDYFGVSVDAVDMIAEKEAVLVFYSVNTDVLKSLAEEVIAALSEQTDENIWEMLSDAQRDSIYSRKQKEYIIEDALSAMDDICDVDIPEDENIRLAIAEAAADDFACHGLKDSNLSYWDNIKSLIKAHL